MTSSNIGIRHTNIWKVIHCLCEVGTMVNNSEDINEKNPGQSQGINHPTLEAFYHKYRIYATEVYRNMTRRKIPRVVEEVKKEYNVPLSTTNKNECFIVNGKSVMLSDAAMRDIVFSFLQEQLKKTTFDSVLEIGCGSGNNLKVLQKRFPAKTFYGLDLAEQMIKEAQVNVPAVKFFCCSAEHIPLEDNSVDVIYTVHALEQMTPFIPAVIKEMKRVCRNRVLFIEPFPEFQNWIGRMHGKRLGYPTTVHSEMQANGFTIETFKSLNFGNPVNKSGILVGLKKKE